MIPARTPLSDRALSKYPSKFVNDCFSCVETVKVCIVFPTIISSFCKIAARNATDRHQAVVTHFLSYPSLSDDQTLEYATIVQFADLAYSPFAHISDRRILGSRNSPAEHESDAVSLSGG